MQALEPSSVHTTRPAHVTPRTAWKPGQSQNPGGKPKTELDLATFLAEPFDDQRKAVDQKWLELAYVLPCKAVRFAIAATKKELGALQQLVTAAAIAKDKRFPSEDSTLTIRVPAKILTSFQAAIVIKGPQPVVMAVDSAIHNPGPPSQPIDITQG